MSKKKPKQTDAATIRVGDRVRVKLSNGWTGSGIVKRAYKNGKYGVDHDGDAGRKYLVRLAEDLTKIAK